MNDQSSSEPGRDESRAADSDPEKSTSPDPETTESRETYDDLGKAVRRAWKAGTEDARRAARDAMPKAKEEFSRGLRDLAWGVSYLTSFGVTLAKEITPEPVEEGWEKGARAGKEAAEAFAERQRQKKEAGDTDEEPPAESENMPVPV